MHVLLKALSATSNVLRSPVFSVFSAAYFARQSFTLGSDVSSFGAVVAFGVAVGFAVAVFAGGTRSERYLVTKASVESPLAAIARSHASFVFVAPRLSRATHPLARASNETLVVAVQVQARAAAVAAVCPAVGDGGAD